MLQSSDTKSYCLLGVSWQLDVAIRSSIYLSLFANLLRGEMKDFLQVFCLFVFFLFCVFFCAPFYVSWICKSVVEKYNEWNASTFCEENS